MAKKGSTKGSIDVSFDMGEWDFDDDYTDLEYGGDED